MDDALSELGEYVSLKLGEALDGHSVAYGELTLEAKADAIVTVMRMLRDDPRCQFVCLIDVCGWTIPPAQHFDVVYHLWAISEYAHRVRVFADGRRRFPPSATFSGCNWFRREAYDLYGILFSSHRTCRILTDYGFERAPATQGFSSDRLCRVRYDEERSGRL